MRCKLFSHRVNFNELGVRFIKINFLSLRSESSDVGDDGGGERKGGFDEQLK